MAHAGKFGIMVFDLTETLTNDIIFAMENQDDDFLFDAKKSCVVPPADSEYGEFEENDSLYSLPHWSSNDGFNLMEEFADSVRVPRVRAELLEVLASGRRVFRNYKNVLRQYPHIDRRFHSFKAKKMRSAVYEWYNALRESWGLERLSQEFEEFDELTRQDFEFKPYNHQKDNDCVIQGAEKIADELKSEFDGEAGSAVAHLWLRKFSYEDSECVSGIVSRTLSDDFAGVLLWSRFQSFSQKTAALIAFFVNQNFRGLGICRELFSQSISCLKSHGVQSFIIADAVQEYLEPLLTRCGFEKKGSVYAADLA